jgi:hypothetical protein
MKPPTVAGCFDDLPADPRERREAFVEFLGQHLFSTRNQRLSAIRQLVESAESRNGLGTIHRQPYEAVSGLEPSGRKAAMELAQTAINLFIQDLLGLLQNIGSDVRFGENHALRYRLWLEVIDLADEDHPVVAEELINRDASRALESYFGRWLNKYGQHR